MTPDRLVEIEKLYHAALERPAGERPEFLAKACAGDEDLRREVESFLTYAESGGSLLDRPAWRPTGNSSTVTMPLAAGAQLGVYRIEAPIGSGGMGIVYRAVDTRLGRRVALKLLLDGAPGRQFQRRFQIEARAISSLSHPHICPLFDVGCQDGIEFLVMEYLEGRTLAERLKKGPLPLEEVSLYAMQILSALDHAHRKGILHRDLKPANIMLTGSGSQSATKLLDFGLAKALDPVHAEPATGDESTEYVTEPGMIVGTPQYLAPEVLQGNPADARSDLHAFGATLYEMLTGRKAFEGKSKGNVLAAVLRDAPRPISELRPGTPAALEMLVKRCLAKNPEERWQSAADLLAAFQLACAPSIPVTAPQAPGKPRTLSWSLAALSCLAVIAALALWWRGRTMETGRPVRFVISAPEKQTLVPKSAAPSPDGRSIVFVAAGESGESALWLRSLDEFDAKRLAGTEGALGPFWSPNARFVGFFASGKLKKIDLATGTVQNICNAAVDLGATWNRSGDIVFAPHNRVPIHRVSASGGEPVPITKLDSSRQENSHRWPHFLPDGRHFLFTARSSLKENTAIYIGSLDSKETRRLAAAQSNAAYADPGYLLYAREGTLLAQRFDSSRLALEGETFAIAASVGQITPSASAFFAVSADGAVLAYQEPQVRRSQLAWYDRSGARLSALGPEGDYTQPRLSPDGKRIALVSPDKESGNRDVWLMDVATGALTRFTSNPANDWFPVWSPDGARIAFSSDRTAPASSYSKSAIGEGGEELIFQPQGSGAAAVTDWSTDGRFLVYHAPGADANFLLWALPLYGERKPLLLVPPEFQYSYGRISPDGKWLAYSSTESGRDEVYVIPFGKQGRRRVSPAGGGHPLWRKDGRELFYIAADGTMMTVEVRGVDGFEAAVPRALFRACSASQSLRGTEEFYDISADGKRFLMNCLTGEGKPSHLIVELHWTAPLNNGRR